MGLTIGTVGNDFAIAGSDSETLLGFPGDDTLLSLDEDGNLQGNQGNDLIQGNGGDDTLYGGQDSDSLFGGEGKDQLFGDKGNDFAWGNEGNDFLIGAEGNDLLFGNQDNDLIFGDSGNDILHGGQHEDSVYGGEGNDSVFGDKGNDLVAGSEGEDYVYGGEGDDVGFGNKQNDHLFGDGGNDTFYGGYDDDTLYGGNGNDWLYGEAGDDFLFPDAGADTLSGGDGSDIFILARGMGGFRIAEANVITDFNFDEDLIESIEDLRFEDFNIFDGSGEYEGSAILQDDRTKEYLAIVEGVSRDILITGTSFIEPPLSLSDLGIAFTAPPSTPTRPPRQVWIVNDTTPTGILGVVTPQATSTTEYEITAIADSSGQLLPDSFTIDSTTGELSFSDPNAATQADYFDLDITITDTDTDTDTTETYRIYTSIQSAIDEAVAGDTLRVAPGTYVEDLQINKSVTLNGANSGIPGNDATRGTNETIINSASGVSGIQILASNVTLDGIETDSDILATANSEPLENIAIQNVRLWGAMDGINLEEAASALVENNLIEGGGGIIIGWFDNATEATVRNNILNEVEFGIWGSLSGSTLDNNIINAGNTVSDSDAGIGGIMVDSSIMNNQVSGYENGAIAINLESKSADVILANNTVEASDIGILISPEVQNASVGNNSFANNTEDLKVSATDPISQSASASFSTAPMNIIIGSMGDDSLTGTENNDLLLPGQGSDTLTGGEGMDTVVYAAIATGAVSGDRLSDFSFGPEGDAIGITGNLSGLNAGTPVVLKDTSSLDGTENAIADTEANVLAVTSSSARVAYARDTGTLYFDRDGDFTTDAIAAVDIGIGNFTDSNLLFLDS
ncbi:NosD domain-containing protein [Phormidium sp. CCY1219]|uniref:NosD domain-containing protein n=1 Tax=Phormidium sp. CCY1219 TaxID=2886104 RepID=UPI002D1F8367|nr:NosD domain-containing protein [Phormidium sp. CCY1219]MEB3825883.1 hypothetical protein [Phormidium sp. CCY1219]